MEFLVLYRTYNIYGSHKDFSLIGEYLTCGCPDFGDAINEIDITIHFEEAGPPRETLEQTHRQHHLYLEKLPVCTFYRSKKRVALAFESKVTTGRALRHSEREPINVEWVKTCFQEIIALVPLVERKLKKTDDFRFELLEEYLRAKLSTLPATSEDLESLSEHLSLETKKKLSTLTEWEKLGVDWEDYHADARGVLNEPFVWRLSDEFAPNGNDTGADVLGMYREWIEKNRSKSSTVFFEQLMEAWEVDIGAPYKNEYTSYTYFQSIVGLAFSEYKLKATCDKTVKTLAVAAIERQLESLDTEWKRYEDCKKKLGACRTMLKKM